MSEHDRWLDPPEGPNYARCSCEPCPLCGGKKLEHRGVVPYGRNEGAEFNCTPGYDEEICECRKCDCGALIAADSPFDECSKCLTK